MTIESEPPALLDRRQMKRSTAVILCGGYARRLWPATKHMPKQLLPVAGKPIIEYLIEDLEATPEITSIYISTNRHYEVNFVEWFSRYQFRKPTHLVFEETRLEEEKRGSIGGLISLVEKLNLSGHLTVLCGDIILGFPIRRLIAFHSQKDTSVLALHDAKDKELVRGKYGIACVNGDRKLISFEEKPMSPKSSLVNTGCFILAQEHAKLLPEYMRDGRPKDALGFLIAWLVEREAVQGLYGYVFDGPWFDIGTFETYDAANVYFSERRRLELSTNKSILSV